MRTGGGPAKDSRLVPGARSSHRPPRAFSQNGRRTSLFDPSPAIASQCPATAQSRLGPQPNCIYLDPQAVTDNGLSTIHAFVSQRYAPFGSD